MPPRAERAADLADIGTRREVYPRAERVGQDLALHEGARGYASAR
ncbi:hypothetical protein [Nocardiopsis dassonvillei]